MDELQENLLLKTIEKEFEQARVFEKSRKYREACTSYMKISSVMRKAAYQIPPEVAQDFFEQAGSVEKRFSAMRARETETLRDDVSRCAYIFEKPRVTWDSLANRNLEIRMKESMGRSRTFLLYGSEGSGKKFLARVAANALGGRFFYARANTILSKYFGEPQKVISELFKTAIDSKPSVVYVDEFDAFSRENVAYSDNTRNVLELIRSRLDYVNAYREFDVYVFCGCREPWELEPGIPEMLTERVYVPQPDSNTRIPMLKRCLAGADYTNVDLTRLAAETEGFSARDINNVCAEALTGMVREQNMIEEITPRTFEGSLNYRPLTQDDFTRALGKLKIEPKSYQERYDKWKKEFGG